MNYYVTLHETYAVTYFVEAKDEQEALSVAKDDLGAEVSRDFVGTNEGEVQTDEEGLGHS